MIKSDDVVISTRVRLARNLVNYPFPIRMSAGEKQSAAEEIKNAVFSSNSYISQNFKAYDIDELKTDGLKYVEKHLVSPEFISKGMPEGKTLIINDTENVSIMINEEDHIRIQVIEDGLNLTSAFDLADKLDNLLSEKLSIAFDERFGYLTQCPTNLGTGMRASVMMHLPALTETGAMSRITANLSKLGIVIRGTYGEGSEVQGAMYQLSNQITLGLSELEAIENLSVIANQVIEKERSARKALAENISYQDRVYRALGILKSARILSSAEFTKLISLVRAGLSAGLLNGMEFTEINKLSVAVGRGNIGFDLSSEERDFRRAAMVRNALKEVY